MKILFAVQGTGNGHISRAREIIPILQQYGDVDILVSGTQSQVSLPFDIKYRLYGLSFTFGKKGGVDVWHSLKSLKAFRLFGDIAKLPVKDYDLVINDFEPVSAWACKLRGKPCIALSHQAAFLSPNTPRPKKKNFFAELVLKHYAPSSKAYGFHFEPYDHFIYTPVIRAEVRNLKPAQLGHYTVYLPAYDPDLLASYFIKIKEAQWHVFTRHRQSIEEYENVKIVPIENDAYLKSLEGANGLITGGGFEAPTEAIFLGKKVMVIPMIGQYEQHCNALGAKKAGCTVVSQVDDRFISHLQAWLNFATAPALHYPDDTKEIIHRLITENKTAK